MQQYKKKFFNTLYKDTFANLQRCLRVNDLDETGDGTHHLSFHMMGFYSFREWTVQKTVDFWMDFLRTIDLLPQVVTIHPDKQDWRTLYDHYPVKIKLDEGCVWSDGSIGGYCTEFYRDGVEIGNIVNTLGTCIDVGFGMERLERLSGIRPIETREECLRRTCEHLLEEGIISSHYGEGYILKKLLTELVFTGCQWEQSEFLKVRDGQVKKLDTWKHLMQFPRYQKKDKQWWQNTHGIDTDQIHKYEGLMS